MSRRNNFENIGNSNRQIQNALWMIQIHQEAAMTSNRARLVALFALSAIAMTMSGWAQEKKDKSTDKKSKPSQPEVRAVDEWIEILKSSKDNRERQKAANALGSFGPKAKSAIPVLIDALKNPEPFVPDQASTALVRIGKD